MVLRRHGLTEELSGLQLTTLRTHTKRTSCEQATAAAVSCSGVGAGGLPALAAATKAAEDGGSSEPSCGGDQQMRPGTPCQDSGSKLASSMAARASTRSDADSALDALPRAALSARHALLVSMHGFPPPEEERRYQQWKGGQLRVLDALASSGLILRALVAAARAPCPGLLMLLASAVPMVLRFAAGGWGDVHRGWLVAAAHVAPCVEVLVLGDAGAHGAVRPSPLLVLQALHAVLQQQRAGLLLLLALLLQVCLPLLQQLGGVPAVFVLYARLVLAMSGSLASVLQAPGAGQLAQGAGSLAPGAVLHAGALLMVVGVCNLLVDAGMRASFRQLLLLATPAAGAPAAGAPSECSSAAAVSSSKHTSSSAAAAAS